MIALQLNNLGLFTYNNIVGQVPPGSMMVASNLVIDKPGVAETRRGFKQFGSPISLPVGTYIDKFFDFQNRLLIHYGTTMAYDSTGAGAFTSYGGTFAPPTGERIRSTKANSNLYFTTNNGIYKIDSLTNNPYAAGGVPALDVTVSFSATVSGFLANNAACAYRITWLYTDGNGNQIEGNPSMAVTLANNSGGAGNATLTFTVPAGITTAYSYRIYRTVQVSPYTVSPSDTYQLAYQAVVTAGQIAALQVTVTDTTPDTLLGQLLYTSPGAQGQFQTNDPPPLAKDICTFLGMTFYFNCQTIQQVFVTLISVGSPNGIQVGDTISIVGTSTYTYTGAASNNFAAEQFKVDTSSTIATNIDNTARNLVSAINQDPANTEFYAYYVSGFSQLPGQILLKARNLSHAAFTVVSSRGGAFSPVIPSSGTSYISSNNTVLNGVYVSKLNQPEAVPATNLLFIGSADQPIYRGYALRDAVIVESKGGVFRITGTSPSALTVTPFDTTVVQYGNDTGVTLNNSVYSYSTQGVVSITESGAQIMSRNIEGDLLALSAPTLYTSFSTLAFGVSYESDRKFILAIEQNTTDAYSTLQYVYNWITQAWTTWNKSISAAIVNPFDNLLYLAESDGQITQERKGFVPTDYADREWAVTIISSTGTSVTLNDVSHAVVGYTLAQNIVNGQVATQSVITAIDTINSKVTVTDTLQWSAGAAGIYQPIDASLTYCPLTCGYVAYIKQMEPSISFIFGASIFTSATLTLSTNLYPVNETVTLRPKIQGGWGNFPWGALPWGVGSSALQAISALLTKNTLQAHWWNISLELNQAFQNISSYGLFGNYDIMGDAYK